LWLFIQFQRPFTDIDRHVADALEISSDFETCGDETKIAACRLMQSQ